MLGRDLAEAARSARWTVTSLDRARLDITDPEACLHAVQGHDAVINAAAYTHVDDAESHEAEAFAVNALGAENLARASAASGATFVQYSTDYVFSGDAREPYAEDATLAPTSAYGRTKAEGERRVIAAHADGTIIMRTAWLYGEHGPNFVRTMMRLYREHGRLTVVDDQQGQPTWSRDVAQQTVRLLESGARSGVVHCTSTGSTTWHGFAQAIVRGMGGDPGSVERTSSDRFPRPAPRPAYSVLGHESWSRFGLKPLRPWREALDEAMQEGIFR